MSKPSRLEVIESLPEDIRDLSLLDWETVCLILARTDVETTRRVVAEAGCPLVELGRLKLPTYGGIRELIKRRQVVAA